MSEEFKTAGASECKEGRGDPQKVGDCSGATCCHLTSNEKHHSAPHLHSNQELSEEEAHQSLWLWALGRNGCGIFMIISGGLFRDCRGTGGAVPLFLWVSLQQVSAKCV